MGVKRDRFRGFSLPVVFSLSMGLAIVLITLLPVSAQAPPVKNLPVSQPFPLQDVSQNLSQPTIPQVELSPLPLLQRLPILQPSFLSQYPDTARLMAVRAFLRGAIHYAEGTYPNPLGASPYRVILGQETFDSFDDHPRKMVTLNWGTPYEVTSDAAGSCQFTSEIWDKLHQDYPHVWRSDLPAFHPQNQDIGCLILWTEMGGYKALMAGTSVNAEGKVAVDVEQFTTSVQTSCTIWASFPCANGVGAYDQAQVGYQKAKAIEEMWQNFQVALADQQQLVDFMSDAIARPQPTFQIGR